MKGIIITGAAGAALVALVAVAPSAWTASAAVDGQPDVQVGCHAVSADQYFGERPRVATARAELPVGVPIHVNVQIYADDEFQGQINETVASTAPRSWKAPRLLWTASGDVHDVRITVVDARFDKIIDSARAAC